MVYHGDQSSWVGQEGNLERLGSVKRNCVRSVGRLTYHAVPDTGA